MDGKWKSRDGTVETTGVDDMITDRPVLAREILYGEEAKANLLEYLRLVLTVQ